MFVLESWRKVHSEHESIEHWHRLAFFHRKRQLYCLGRGMFALRQGQPTCITCDDECFAASYPRPAHVGRAKLPSTCLSSKVNTPACRRRLLFRVSTMLLFVNRIMFQQLRWIGACIGDESANGGGSAASGYRQGVYNHNEDASKAIRRRHNSPRIDHRANLDVKDRPGGLRAGGARAAMSFMLYVDSKAKPLDRKLPKVVSDNPV